MNITHFMNSVSAEYDKRRQEISKNKKAFDIRSKFVSRKNGICTRKK